MAVEGLGVFQVLARAGPEFTVPDDPATLDFDALAVEFTRLFCGPGPYVAPYGSVHRRDDERAGQLWGSTTGEVQRFMAHYGLEPTHTGAIPDHIAVLFEFMARVIRAKVEAGGTGDEGAGAVADDIQRQFLRQYMLPWVDTFLQRVEQAKPPPFYRALGVLTAQFLAYEREALQPGAGA